LEGTDGAIEKKKRTKLTPRKNLEAEKIQKVSTAKRPNWKTGGL